MVVLPEAPSESVETHYVAFSPMSVEQRRQKIETKSSPLMILVSLPDVKSVFSSVSSEMSTPRVKGAKENHPKVFVI